MNNQAICASQNDDPALAEMYDRRQDFANAILGGVGSGLAVLLGIAVVLISLPFFMGVLAIAWVESLMRG